MKRPLILFASVIAMLAPAALADEIPVAREAVYQDVEKSFGSVPSFLKAMPRSALAGMWLTTKQLELSDKTALQGKTKALISLAVAAQIPCEYCVWMDTATAKQFGASDEEIGEAVAIAGLTRAWSTNFHGLQVDINQFKMELARH